MIYQEYDKLLKEYKKADNNYDRVLESKAKLYFGVEPKSVDTSKEIVDGGKRVDSFTLFVEKIEKIDIELQQARNERDLKNYLLKKKELEIRESKEVYDRIYVMYFMDKLKVKYIARHLIYSYQRIYQILDEIKVKTRTN